MKDEAAGPPAGRCLRSTSADPCRVVGLLQGYLRRTRQQNGPLPMGARSIYRYLHAECLDAWVRNQVICRYVLPCPAFQLSLFTRRHPPFCLLFCRLSPSGILQRYPAVRATPWKRRDLSPSALRSSRIYYMYIHTRARYSSRFHRARIDITRSTISTLKPLSRCFLFLVRMAKPWTRGLALTMAREDNIAVVHGMLLYTHAYLF